MPRIEMAIPAPREHDVFAPTAMDNVVGQKTRVDGHESTIVAARVFEDGKMAYITVDVPTLNIKGLMG